MSGEFDLLITGGEVVDGTGNPSFRAALGVREGRIHLLRGDTSDIPAREYVDASGLVVCPGFIDAHSHSDLWLFTDPLLEAKVRQGVTTEVIGVDGLSYAPFADRQTRDAFMMQNGGIAGINDSLPDWRTVGEQLAAYDRRTSVNVATFVGNTALRIGVLGWEDVPARRQDVVEMKAVLRDAMDQGALGLSSGLDYPPGSYADFDEIVELAAEAGRAGGIYHTHVRYGLGDRFFDPFREAVDISLRSEAPLQITHFSKSARDSSPLGAQRLLDLVDQERAKGVQLTFDTYPYEWGGTRLARLLPAWVQAGHPAEMPVRLADSDTRRQVGRDVMQSPAVLAYKMSRPFSDLRIGNLTHGADVRQEGRYLSEVVVDRGGDLADVLIELVIRNPAATFTRPSPHAMTLWKFVVHPLGMIASDSVFIGKAASPRAFGCFARVLGDFVREERLLSLPEAVRKMTSMPAGVLGLSNRGVIKEGAHADITILDPSTVGASGGYEAPREFAVGVRDVFVGGVSVLRNGVITGAMPGRAIRRQDT